MIILIMKCFLPPCAPSASWQISPHAAPLKTFAIIKNFFAFSQSSRISLQYLQSSMFLLNSQASTFLHYLQSARISLHYSQSSRIFAFFAVIEICLHYSQPSRIVLHFRNHQQFLHSLHLAKAAQRATRLCRIVGQGYSQVGTFWVI